MPKRVGFLYEQMLDKQFIKLCILRGIENKSKDRPDVKIVIENIDAAVEIIYLVLANYNYTPTPPYTVRINDNSSGKPRDIAIQPFDYDGIIHLCEAGVLIPVIMRGMHKWCCASVPTRGGKYMLDRNKEIVQRHPKNSKYVAVIDVKKFYPSIPQKRLIAALERKIKDKKFILLLAVTMACYEPGLKYAIEHNLSPYDIVGDKIGLHIGFVTSQWEGNYYLEPLDRFILSLDGVKAETRYMDNIYIYASNKRKLHRALDAIRVFLDAELGLRIKEDWQIFPIDDRPVSTVGFRIYRDHVDIKPQNFLRIKRQSGRIQKKINNHIPIPPQQAASFLGKTACLKFCDSQKVKEKYVYPIGINRLKKIISDDAKRKNKERQQHDNQGRYKSENRRNQGNPRD